MNEPSLVVLAAGMGSRYRSLKQIDKFGPSGETIIDYTIYDAIKTGFGKIVFVIRKHIEKEFKEIFHNKFTNKVKIDYVFQEIDSLPQGEPVPTNRKKPWGTGHAVMVAKEKIDGPFAIVNADDFYGRSSLQKMHDQLCKMDNNKLSACLLGFVLENTLSEYGHVSRGICKVGQGGNLLKIVERTKIFKNNDEIYYEENNDKINLTGKEIVSMNLMGFTAPVFELIEEHFTYFLQQHKDDPNQEYYIPTVLDNMIKSGVNVPVLTTSERWFGLTYQEDKQMVKTNLMKLIDAGVYPENLWA